MKIVDESDPVAKLSAFAQAVAAIHLRVANVHLLVRDAGASDHEMAKLWRLEHEQRREGMEGVLQRSDICAALLRLLSPYTGRIGWEGAPTYPVDLALGWLNASMNDVDVAIGAFARVEQLAERMGTRTHVARVRFWRGSLTGSATNVAQSRTEMRAARANGVLSEDWM